MQLYSTTLSGQTDLSVAQRIGLALPYVLLAAYAVFTCGYFLFDEYGDHYRFYSRFLFFLSLFVIAEPLRELARDRLFLLVVAYLLYLLLSAFWSEPFDWFRLGQKGVIAVYILSFFALTRYLLQWRPDLYRLTLLAAVAVAAGSALYTLLDFYGAHPFPDTRLEGWGSLTNINEFSNVYGVFALLAAAFALQSGQRAVQLACLLAVGLFLAIAWFGQSRTAFVSLCLVLGVQTALALPRGRVAVLACLLGFVGALPLLFPGSLESALLRGVGLRPEIWTALRDLALSAPVFGLGLISDIHVVVEGWRFETAHNAYLQVFLHGGAVGLLLFLGLLGAALHRSWGEARSSGHYTIPCLLLFCALAMLTGVDTLIERPRDQWLLFWFPLALLLGGAPGDRP